MIRVYKLWKQFGDAPPILRDLSLHVNRGEFVFLTGPSGSGKTSLLRILVGEERPSAGQVVIAGKDVGVMATWQIPYLRRMIGFVFQDFKLLPNKTAFENVALVLRISGLPPGEQRVRAVKAIRRVGLEHRMHYYPPMLSGGEQQRIAIARAVVNDPALLLADEPTGNLDPALSLDILNIFREINARGTTVVVATHDPRLINAVQRRVVWLTGKPETEEGEAPLRERAVPQASGSHHDAILQQAEALLPAVAFERATPFPQPTTVQAGTRQVAATHQAAATRQAAVSTPKAAATVDPEPTVQTAQPLQRAATGEPARAREAPMSPREPRTDTTRR